MSRLLALWRRWFPPRHVHMWETVGYGGAGWYSVRCTGCGEKDIA